MNFQTTKRILNNALGILAEAFSVTDNFEFVFAYIVASTIMNSLKNLKTHFQMEEIWNL